MAQDFDAEAVLKRLCELAAGQVGADPATVTPDTHLYNDLGFDSLDTVDYVMQLEEEFEVSIPDELVEELEVNTPGQAFAALQHVCAASG